LFCRLATAGAVCLILGVHWRFASWGLGTGFTYDDLMNLGRSIQVPVGTALADIFLFWRPSELLRPVPELLYRLTWAVFGANPAPLRVLSHLLMLANAALAFWVARAAAPQAVALTVALLVAHHPFFHWMYANSGFLFDLVCFAFYFAALGVYLRAQHKSWYLVLLIPALGSKEIAVTLPAVLTVWELTLGGKWDWRRARPLAAGHAIVAAFLCGRVFDAHGIANAAGYEASYSVASFAENASTLLQQAFAARNPAPWLFTGALVVALACAILPPEAGAARLGLAAAVIGAAPILALTGRSLPAAYIPYAGLAMALASSLYALLLLLVRRPAIAGVVLFLFAARWTWRESVRWEVLNEEAGAESRYVTGVLGQMRGLDLRLPRGARILMMEDPFPASRWMSTFAFIILTGDGTIAVDWPSEGRARSPYAATLTFQDGRLRRLD
jgi:hypothetical protein